jgi:tetratricopeptide (TPR) repeat protein
MGTKSLRLRLALILVLASAATGCASLSRQVQDNVDPWRAERADIYRDYLRAEINAQGNRPRQAAVYLDRALARDPANPDLLGSAMSARIAAGDGAGAARIARNAATANVTLILQPSVLAAEALSGGKPADAVSILSANNLSPYDIVLSGSIKAAALAAQGNFDGAMLATNRRLDGGGMFDRVQTLTRALVLDAGGRTPEAILAYEQAERDGVILAAAVARHGAALERVGRKDDAIALYRDLLSQLDNVALSQELARATAGGAPPPPPTFAQAAALGVFAPAILLDRNNNPLGVMPWHTLALMLDPKFEPARIALAETWAENGRVDEAYDELGRVDPSSSYYSTARLRQVWALEKMKRPEDARTLAQNEVTRSNRSRNALRTLLELDMTLDRNAEAETILTELITTSAPQEWRLYFQRAVVRHKLNRWPEAQADLEAALALEPNSPEVLNYLGYTWVDRGERLAEGLAMIQKAAQLRPNSGAIIDSLGWAQYRMGNFADAVVQLERAVELEPGDATLNEHLGDAYFKVGRVNEARFQWTRALSLSPSLEEEARLRAKVAGGPVT